VRPLHAFLERISRIVKLSRFGISILSPDPTSKSGGVSVSSEYRYVDATIRSCGNSSTAGIGLSRTKGVANR
jgi:hypothetical protein